MRHFASAKLWVLYSAFPEHVRALADKDYFLLRSDQHHPSLHVKRVGKPWAVRVGEHYRALGIDVAKECAMVLDRHARRVRPLLGD